MDLEEHMDLECWSLLKLKEVEHWIHLMEHSCLQALLVDNITLDLDMCPFGV
jgi:hypothetical protein